MTPPARPGVPVPRAGRSRPAPPRPRPPHAAPTRPADGTPPDGTPPQRPTDASPEGASPDGPAGRPSSAGAPVTGPSDPAAATTTPERPRASATSEAVTTYTAGRRSLGVPNRPVVSSGSAARFAERVAMRRRLARHRVYLAAAVAVLVAALAWLTLLSPVLALDAAQVEVTGAGTVVDVADVHALVAQVDGVPLPRLDTVGLRDRVLEVPGVREAKVSRSWPHGLAIALVSREPVAAVPQREPEAEPGAPAEPGYALLDVEGYPVGWTAAPPEGLPVVSVPVVREGRNRSLDAVLAILQALPPELAAEVATIEAETRDTVRMTLRDGKSVVWGSASDAALKIRVLQALRAAPAAAGAREYDVSAPTLPITR